MPSLEFYQGIKFITKVVDHMGESCTCLSKKQIIS